MARRLMRGWGVVVVMAIAASMGARAQNVTNERLLKGLSDPGEWLNYSGD